MRISKFLLKVDIFCSRLIVISEEKIQLNRKDASSIGLHKEEYDFIYTTIRSGLLSYAFLVLLNWLYTT